jgi:delta 1-pyrroline-5-carboxylate dehydrogenase
VNDAALGNNFVNRNMIGAVVVCVQPYSDEGLSGTGRRAGGQPYLQRVGRAAVARRE